MQRIRVYLHCNRNQYGYKAKTQIPMKFLQQTKPTRRLDILSSLETALHLLGKPKSLNPDAPTALFLQWASDQEKPQLLWCFNKKLTRGNYTTNA